jgi:hypothetical protein
MPFSAGPHGGLRLSTGDEQDNNIIRAALGSQDNNNAFQQEDSVGETSIFDINDEATQAVVVGKIRRVFEQFERLKRFKLIESSIRLLREDGDQVLYFKYLNLETDREQEFSRNMSSQGETEGPVTNG